MCFFVKGINPVSEEADKAIELIKDKYGCNDIINLRRYKDSVIVARDVFASKDKYMKSVGHTISNSTYVAPSETIVIDGSKVIRGSKELKKLCQIAMCNRHICFSIILFMGEDMDHPAISLNTDVLVQNTEEGWVFIDRYIP